MFLWLNHWKKRAWISFSPPLPQISCLASDKSLVFPIFLITDQNCSIETWFYKDIVKFSQLIMAKITKLEKIPSADILMQKKKFKLWRKWMSFQCSNTLINRAVEPRSSPALHATPRSAPHRQLCNPSGTHNTGFSKWVIFLSLKKKNYPRG